MATSNTKFTKMDIDQNAQKDASGYDQNQANIASDRASAANLQAPTAVNNELAPAAQIATGPQDQTRNNQNALVGQLQAQANGTGPSLAAGVLRQGTDRNLAGLAAAAASGQPGGSNPALAARQLATQNVVANQTLGQQVAQQRMQEQINAQNQLGGVLSNQRSQDIGLATGQAGLNQQTGLAQGQLNNATSLANLQAGVTTNGQGLQAAQGFDSLGLNSINSQTGAALNSDQQAISYDQWQQNAQAEQDRANAAGINGLIGAGIGAAGSIATGYLTPPKK